MKKFSRKNFIIGVLVVAFSIILMGAGNINNGPGRYQVSVGGAGGNNYAVCVTDTWTGETRCQQGGGPKTHDFSPGF
jgi:hypothetical protein